MQPATCGRCGALVEANAATCERCRRPFPGLFGLRPALLRVFPTAGDLNRALILVLAGIYLVTLLYTQRHGGLEFGSNPLAWLSPSMDALVRFGMLLPRDVPLPSEPWRTLTCVFLHGSLAHIVFNAMALNVLGTIVERLLGSARLVIVFVVSGIGGSLASLLIEPHGFVVGASGAIFGLNAAIIAYGYRRGGTVGAEVRGVAWRWLIGSFIFATMIANVSHAAHIGGAITGGLCAWFMQPRRAGEKESDGALLLGLACLALTIACGIAQAFSPVRY